MNGKIGLFGGTFDPVHVAHLITASIIRCEFNLERVYFIPNYVSPFKTENHITSINHRIEMLKKSITDNDCFEICEYESKMKRPVYTHETIAYFKEKYPGMVLFLIIGSDCYKTLHQWKEYDYIIENAEIIVALRQTAKSLNEKSHNVNFSKFCPFMDVSSSAIRRMVANNLDIKYLVNRDVRSYITEHRLYKCDIQK